MQYSSVLECFAAVIKGGAFVGTKLLSGHPPSFFPAFHRGPPGARGPMIPPLLSLPPPPRGRGRMRGGFGPRSGPYGRAWWGLNTEPPFPGPGHGGPFRESFHEEPRNPRRPKSWSLVKNACPPKDGPRVMEGKATVSRLCWGLCASVPAVFFGFCLKTEN